MRGFRPDSDRASPAPLHVGVVTGGSETVWVGVAPTREALVAELAAFLLPRVPYQLYDGPASRFRRLLEAAEPERAVQLYFEHVGERWDREELTVVTRDWNQTEMTPPGMERRREGSG